MNYKKYFRNYLTLFVFSCTVSFGQTIDYKYQEIGKPFVQQFSNKIYKGSPNNWSVVQDNRGIMYFGNDLGIIEYDGNTWRTIMVPNFNGARTLAVDKNGRVFVSAIGDFGYIEADSLGQEQFKSLLPKLENKYRDFGEIWDVVSSSHGVYFKTKDKIFRWNYDNEIKVWDSVNSYRLYNVDDNVYARNKGIGLVKIEGDSLNLMRNGEYFSSLGVFDMLPFKNSASDINNKILVTTNYEGLFLYEGYKFRPFKTEADSFLKENQIYNACITSDGNFAFATQRGGVAIINHEGKLLRVIDENSGLPTNIVYDVLSIKSGGLWLATATGLVYCEEPSSFSIFKNSGLLKNMSNSVLRFNNKIYAANEFGIIYYSNNIDGFKLIDGSNKPAYSLLNADGTLLAGTNWGTVIIEKNKIKKFIDKRLVNKLLMSKKYPGRIYVGHDNGFSILEKQKNGQIIVGSYKKLDDDITNIVEEDNGDLWLSGFFSKFYHISDNSNEIDKVNSANVEYTSYDYKKDLPGRMSGIFNLQGKMLLSTSKGIFRFDKISNLFLPDTIFGNVFLEPNNNLLLLEKSKNDNLWILAKLNGEYELCKAVLQKNRSYKLVPIPETKRLDLRSVNALCSDYNSDNDEEILWISTEEGLVRYNTGIKKNLDIKYPTLIRKVSVEDDSIIYGGTYSSKFKTRIELPYSKRNIHFEFTVPYYDNSEENLFQFYLEGYDKGWSKWSNSGKKDYTNLSHGDYKFYVRSKNTYSVISGEDVFIFKILSPWYLSWWIYIVYTLLLLLFLYLIRAYELNRLKLKNQLKLEKVKMDSLRNLDQLKSNFFTNISHEFRTPITLILGHIESVISSSKIDFKEKEKLKVADRNAKRLLSLINQLLDLSKIEAGSMELNTEIHNIVSFLKNLFFSFESLAENKKIELKFESQNEYIPVHFDPDKMEEIFVNLLSNAYKFTQENGEIKVILELEKPLLRIKIIDSGIGIRADRLSHIFNRFYQADNSSTREHEGTGIGLALVKELIDLHGWEIAVKSKEGVGTEFIITLQVDNFNFEKRNQKKLDEKSFVHKNNFQDAELVMPAEETIENGVGLGSDKDTILIVEDNLDVRNYVKEQLEKIYKIIQASNGEEGVIIAQDEIPDLIITDAMMPKLDGYQLCKKIRRDEKTSHIPIIMLTAKAGLEDKIEGLETGVDAYITKPFSPKELQVTVKNLISIRERLRKRFSNSTKIKPSEVSNVSTDQKFLQKIMIIVERSFEDKQFGVEKLAEEVNMSVSQLNRKLNALVNQPAGQLISSLRLQRAADLLTQNAGTVSEISYLLGYNDQAYFSRVFKKQFGCSPSEYKKIKPQA